jgi:hypothetical protein
MARTEGRGNGEFFLKEIRLMDKIILIKSQCFKYTVEKKKVLNDVGFHLENNCNSLRLVTNRSILQPKCVEQKATYGASRSTSTIKVRTIYLCSVSQIISTSDAID